MTYKPRVILLDDDQDDRDLLRFIYESYSAKDIDLILTKSSDELFNYLGSNMPPEIIVLDQNMPRMTGLEIFKKIKQNYQYQHIKIIIFTTVVDNFFREKAIEIGASAVIEKPLYFDQMVNVFIDILHCADNAYNVK